MQGVEKWPQLFILCEIKVITLVIYVTDTFNTNVVDILTPNKYLHRPIRWNDCLVGICM